MYNIDLLRAQIGAFVKRDNADKLVASAKQKGYSDAFVTDNGDGLFRVQIGAFKETDNADSCLKKAVTNGYTDAFIVGINNNPSTEPVNKQQVDNPKATVPNGKTIGIAIGHGGSDGGAVCRGFVEKDMNLTIGIRLRDRLNDHGFKVILNRAADIAGREAAFAAEIDKKVDAACAVHFNAFSDPSANGFEVGKNRNHSVTESERLCSLIESKVIADIKIKSRGIKTFNFAMTNYTYPCAYLEGGFITNDSDRYCYDKEEKLFTLAECYCKGFCEYFGVSYCSDTSSAATPLPSPAPSPKKTAAQIADDIWYGRATCPYSSDGKWGSDPKRKEWLIKYGGEEFRETVQAEPNKR